LQREFSNYRCVKYRPELKGQILELQKYMWSSDAALNAAYLEWKYGNNPYLDTKIYVVLCDEQIVGMLGAYGAKWQSGDSDPEFVVPCLGDLVFHPDHRQQGLLSKIVAFALDDLFNSGFMYIFDLSSGPDLILGMLMTGWRRAGFLQTSHWSAVQNKIPSGLRKYADRLTFVSSTYRLLRENINKICFRHSHKQSPPFDAFDRNEVLRNSIPNVAIEKAPRAAAMADLVERVGNYKCIRHLRDEQFYSWRFQNPLSQYRFLYWGDACLEGYLVLQVSGRINEGKAWANLVDWEVSRAQVWSDLFEAIASLGNFDSISIWSATLSKAIRSVLENFGFSFVDKTGIITKDVKQPTILVKSRYQEIPPSDWMLGNRHLLDLANWDLRMFYSDNY